MSLKYVSTSALGLLRNCSRGGRCMGLSVPSRNESTYKAAIMVEPKKPLKIEDVHPQKKLKPGQVRLDVRACSVNMSDYLTVEGEVKQVGPTPGYEMSGVVMETKDCQSVAKGDRVVALNKDNLGGFAEQCVVNESDVWTLPSSLSFTTAVALVDSFGTALLGFSRHGHLLHKQIVIVTMAPGQGYAALDVAANVYKTKVIAVTMNEKETESLRNRGAWSALCYSEKRLLQVTKELTKDLGVDVIYDTMAGEVLKSCLKCVKHEGHILVAGFTLKEIPQVQISQLLSLPSFYLSGVSLQSYRQHAYATYRQTVADAIEMYEQKLIKPTIAYKFPLKEVNKALEVMKEDHPIGKVVLTMKDE